MKSLIFGITGQDGSYLAELLLSKGHQVFGAARRTSTPSTQRIDHILPQISLLRCDITDYRSVDRILQQCRPDWIFNLAAQSHVGTSFNEPYTSIDITGKGCL